MKLCPSSKLLDQPCPLARLQRSCWWNPRSHDGADTENRRSSWASSIKTNATAAAANGAMAAIHHPSVSDLQPSAGRSARAVVEAIAPSLSEPQPTIGCDER